MPDTLLIPSVDLRIGALEEYNRVRKLKAAQQYKNPKPHPCITLSRQYGCQGYPVAERLCEQMDLTPEKMLDYLKGRGCKIGGVTMGEKGLLWYDETGTVQVMPAMPIPRERVIDTNGAGDVFHGAYVYSYLAHPGKSWREHFDFARAASTFKIQRLGNEAGLPTLVDIAKVRHEFEVRV